MGATRATIHIIDDEVDVRRALSRLLAMHDYDTAEYGSAAEFLHDERPRDEGCVLLDLELSGELDGMALQRILATGGNPLPVVFLTGRASVSASVSAMKAGAIDFLEKPVDEAPLLDAIGRALAFDARQRGERDQRRQLATAFGSLTPREREVFAHVVAGRLNKQIAWDIGACERTVKAHRARVMAKLRVSSVAQLVHVADRIEAFGLTSSVTPINARIGLAARKLNARLQDDPGARAWDARARCHAR